MLSSLVYVPFPFYLPVTSHYICLQHDTAGHHKVIKDIRKISQVLLIFVGFRICWTTCCILYWNSKIILISSIYYISFCHLYTTKLYLCNIQLKITEIRAFRMSAHSVPEPLLTESAFWALANTLPFSSACVFMNEPWKPEARVSWEKVAKWIFK